MQVLIDFNSDEGEAMRNAQLRELRVLNGTLQEDKDIDYKALFTNPQKAAITGPLGASAGIRAQLALPAPLSSPFEATTSASNEEAEYAKMMAEIGGLADETGDAPAGAAAAGGGAPPPAAAAPLPATPRLNHVGYAASPPGYPPRPGMPGMMPPQQHMQMQPQMPMYAQGPVRGGAVRGADADAAADGLRPAADADAVRPAADADAVRPAADAAADADADAATAAAAAGLPGPAGDGPAADAAGLRTAHDA